MLPKTTDFLLVGAGPTGLTLACELLRRGLQVLLIDTLAAPTTQSRALALQARSLEIFEKLGCLDKFLDQGLRADTVHLYEKGQEIGHASFSDLPIDYPFVLILPQSDTEAILTHHLHQLGGHLHRATTLISLQGTTATLSSSGQTHTVTARWIIGCDGAHSTLRHALKLPFPGTRFSENFGLADVTISDFPLPPHHIHGFLTPHGILGCIPLPTPHTFRLIITFPSRATPPLDIPFLQHLLQTATHHPLTIPTIHWASTFSIHRRLVPKFSVGPLFLCGDAAHIHSPAGGQGLNIGIQDAFNLAWKLDLVHTHHFPPALLSTYHRERHPIARHTLWATTLATFFLSTPYPLLRHLIFRLLARLFHLRPFRKRLLASLAEITTHYRPPLFSLWPSLWFGPKPGHLAPFLSNDPDPHFLLLIFGNPSYNPHHPLLTLRHLPLDHTLALPYHATQPCLYLIRPDGYIAYRSRKFPKEFSLANYLF